MDRADLIGRDVLAAVIARVAAAPSADAELEDLVSTLRPRWRVGRPGRRRGGLGVQEVAAHHRARVRHVFTHAVLIARIDHFGSLRTDTHADGGLEV